MREGLVRRSPASIDADWTGEPIERVVSRLGDVLAIAPGPVLQELTFAGWRVFVHEGRVVLARSRS